MKPVFYAYLITVLVLTACSSGKSTFEHGNYYEAVITSVSRLRKNSDHKKSVETLRQAYPMAVAYFEDRAKTSLASTEQFKWTGVVDSYTSINNMYDDIKRCPGALAVIPNPVNYYSKLQEARQNAAEEHYAAGILALQAGNRESAKKAYAFFKTANTFVPGYKEVNSYLEAALNAATVKIVVEPIPVHSKAVGVSAEFFNDKISEYVHSTAINDFVKFYTREEAKKIKLNPDHIIQLEFDEFTVGQVTRNEKEIHLTKDSIVLATYVTSSNGTQQTTTQVAGGNLVTTNSNVVATTQSPVTTTQTANTTTGNDEKEKAAKALAEKQAAEKALAAQQLAEKQRVEKEAAAKALAAQQLADKQKAEKEAAEKALAEKQKAEQEAAAKALAAQQLAERQTAEKEAAEKALAEKQRAEKEAADNALAAQQLADKQKADKEAAERALAAQQLAEKQKAEKEAAEKALAEKQQAEKEAAAKALAAQQLAEKQKAEKEAAEKALAEKQKAEREALEKAKAEKEKADKEKAEKEKAEMEKNAAEKNFDPTIKKEDTTDVKDPVTICHIPPGNKMNHRTLVISRSALQAHLGHGDAQGSCEPNEKQKAAPQDGNKGPEEKKGSDEKKNDKGSDKKGSGKTDAARDEHALLFNGDPVFLASAETAVADYLRYLNVEADTNKVYGTVKATLYQYRKATTSKGVVGFRIIDAKTGALLSAEKMPGEFVWVSEWATFNGDERALSPEQLRLTRLKEQAPPPPQDLFIEFTKPIYEQITTKIRDFYKNY